MHASDTTTPIRSGLARMIPEGCMGNLDRLALIVATAFGFKCAVAKRESVVARHLTSAVHRSEFS